MQGDVRDVVVIGERFHDKTGEIVGTQGFYLDVTPSAKQRQESITEALAEIADHRAAIEQAKGVLMCVYGIGPDAAFDILKWRRRTQTSNCARSPSNWSPTSSHSSTTKALRCRARRSTSCYSPPTNESKPTVPKRTHVAPSD